MKIKDIPKIDRPREKLQKYGPGKLSNSELLAIMLGTGIKGTNATELSKKILQKFGGINLLNIGIDELKKIPGLGVAKSSSIIASLELTKRLLNDENSKKFTAEKIWDDLREFRDHKKEHFIAYYLDVRGSVIERQIISVGTVASSIVHPREVFEPAVKLSAFSVTVAHNHPTGDINPSNEDIELTKKLIEAGKIMGIELNDHIIVGKEHFFSFKDGGHI